jgi:hypothetical protein
MLSKPSIAELRKQQEEASYHTWLCPRAFHALLRGTRKRKQRLKEQMKHNKAAAQQPREGAPVVLVARSVDEAQRLILDRCAHDARPVLIDTRHLVLPAEVS